MAGALPSAVILGAAMGVALHLALSRGWAEAADGALRRAARTGALTLLLQACHFGEELATGFAARFPQLFGLPPMAERLFAGFNVAWLAIWAAACAGLVRRQRAALFALWFLGIGAAANGLAHPALAAVSGGYFPGLLSAPAVGVAGVVLLRRLLLATRPLAPSPRAA